MSRRPILVWSSLALVGVLIAVGVSYAASRLASPHVGLSSEPITAGAKLAPASAARDTKPTKARRKHERRKPGKSTTPAAPPTPASPPPATGTPGGSGSTPGGSGSTPGGSGSGSGGHGSDDSGGDDSGGSGGHGSDDGQDD